MLDNHNFTATKWDTADDKERWLKHAKRFIMSGFNENLFYKWFYTRLSMMFGHIAEYNKNQFYVVWFDGSAQCNDWVNHILRARCYGQPDYTWSDVEVVLQDWIKEYYS